MKKRNIFAIITFILLCIWLYFSANYKIVKIQLTTNSNNVITESFLLPNYAKLHLYNSRLQYTKANGWHQSIYYNVKSYKQIK